MAAWRYDIPPLVGLTSGVRQCWNVYPGLSFTVFTGISYMFLL